MDHDTGANETYALGVDQAFRVDELAFRAIERERDTDRSEADERQTWSAPFRGRRARRWCAQRCFHPHI